VSYTEASGALARALARVVLTPPPQVSTPAEVALLAAYRTDVLTSLTGLHRTLLAAGPAGGTRVADLEQQPVATLGVLLARHPRSPASELSPSERADARPVSPLTQAWRDAARHALLTESAARRLQRGWNAAEDVAWAAVADLATAVEAFAVAETDLHRLAAGPPDTALPVTVPAGLRLAAAECGRLARAGPLLPLLEDPLPASPPAAVRVVSRPEDLPDAQLRVAALLAAPPTPALLAQVAVGQARACVAAARLLAAAAAADPRHAAAFRQAADALTDRAERLGDVAAGCDRVRGLHPGAGLRAVHQTGELMRYLQRLADTLPPSAAAETAPAVLGFARNGARVLTTVNEVTDRAFAAGCYLIPNPSPGPAWVPAHPHSDPPALLHAAGAAAASEESRRDVFATPGGQPARPAAADQLRRSLAARTPARPALPADPLPAPPGTSRWWQLCAAIDPRVLDDPHWPALAAALTRAEQAGADVPATLHEVTEQRALPGAHPARSLHYRLLDACDAALSPPTSPPRLSPPTPAAATVGTAGPARHRSAVPR